MKKLFTVFIFLLGLVACGSPGPDRSNPKDPKDRAEYELAADPSLVGLANLMVAASGQGQALQVVSSLDAAEAVADGSAAVGLAYASPEVGRAAQLKILKAAWQPVAVVVNLTNPVHDLSLVQLRRILLGETTNWKELGGADQAITVVLPGAKTVAMLAISSGPLAGKQLAPARRVNVQTEMAVSGVVREDPGAMGFLGARMLDAGVKALTVEHAAASSANLNNHTYPLSVQLVWLLPQKPTAEAQDWIRFAFSAAGRTIFEKQGWEPVQAAGG